MKSELRGAAFAGGAVLIVMAAFLTLVIGKPGGLRWLAQALGVWALVCWSTWRRLPLNRASPEAPLYPDLGWANRSTLLRGVLIAGTAGFLGHSTAAQFTWLPGLMYMTSAIIDRLDGFIARHTGQSSLLGAEMDTLLDALGLVIAPLLAVAYGKLHWSFLLVSIAFYLFRAAVTLRARAGLPVYPLPPSPMRRALAGFQMGLVAMVLLPLFQPPFTQLLGWCFMVPILAGFLMDWFAVTGRMDFRAEASKQREQALTEARDVFLLPPLRLVFSFGLCWLVTAISSLPMFIALSGFGVLVVLGAAARFGALGVLTFLAWHHGAQPLNALTIFVILCSVTVLFLGSGHWSLWQGDSDWVNRHDGA